MKGIGASSRLFELLDRQPLIPTECKHCKMDYRRTPFYPFLFNSRSWKDPLRRPKTHPL